MKHTTKKWLGALSWVPLAIFTFSVLYFMYFSSPVLHSGDLADHNSFVAYLNAYYEQMFFWLFLGSVLGLSIMLVFIVHLLRLRSMNSATKAIWIVFMAFTGSFALPVFYYMQLRDEPDNIALYPSIG